MGALGEEFAAHNGALARYDMLGTIGVDVGFEVQAKYFSRAQGAGSHPIGAEAALVVLDVFLHQGRVAVFAVHCVVQAALVEVLLRDLEAAVGRRALDGRVLAVQHDVVVDVYTLSHPVAACLAVRALDNQLIQHRLDNLGHGAHVLVSLDGMATRRTRPPAVGLRGPCVVETLAAEVVLAGELDGLVKGRVADQADEVAVGRGDVFEVLELGGCLDDSAVSTLRGG